MLSYAPDALAEKLSQAVFRCYPDGVTLPSNIYGELLDEDKERFRRLAVSFCNVVLIARDEFWTSESEAVAQLVEENRQLKLLCDGLQISQQAIEAKQAEEQELLRAAREVVAALEQEHASLLDEITKEREQHQPEKAPAFFPPPKQ